MSDILPFQKALEEMQKRQAQALADAMKQRKEKAQGEAMMQSRVPESQYHGEESNWGPAMFPNKVGSGPWYGHGQNPWDKHHGRKR